MLLQLLLFTFIILTSSQSCQAYILRLAQISQSNKVEFAKQIAQYASLSGKLVDDLGLPTTCSRSANLSYFVAHLISEGVQNQYNAYLGLCFTNRCNADDLNVNGGFLIDTMLNASVTANSTLVFISPNLQPEISANAIVFILLLFCLIMIGMKQCLFKFTKMCIKETRKQQEEDQINRYSIQFGEDYDPSLLIVHEKEGFFKKNCILQKFQVYWTPEQNSKVIGFSAFRILSIPLAYYGYLFYLCNIACTNYFSFNKQIYQETFSKIAIAAYYLPDTLFFISGFIFAKKAFLLIEVQNNPVRPLLGLLGKKMMKLYPIYWAVILIYWQISPSLHGGPVWYQYEAETAYCRGGWWRSLLLIDNWFQNGCYSFAWFVPVQFQLSLISVILFIVYSKKKKIGLITLGLALVASWILVLVISSPLPSSLETTMSYNAQKYFKSTYSHLPFYLLGVLNAYFAHHEGIKQLLKRFTQIKILRIISIIIGAILIILVVDKPGVWQNFLGFELGLARTGMFIGIYLFLFWGIFDGIVRKTMIHRYSSLFFGCLMIGGIIVSSNYWSLECFPYLDQNYLFNTTLSNIIIGLIFGGSLCILIWPKPQKQQDQIIL